MGGFGLVLTWSLGPGRTELTDEVETDGVISGASELGRGLEFGAVGKR